MFKTKIFLIIKRDKMSYSFIHNNSSYSHHYVFINIDYAAKFIHMKSVPFFRLLRRIQVAFTNILNLWNSARGIHESVSVILPTDFCWRNYNFQTRNPYPLTELKLLWICEHVSFKVVVTQNISLPFHFHLSSKWEFKTKQLGMLSWNWQSE